MTAGAVASQLSGREVQKFFRTPLPDVLTGDVADAPPLDPESTGFAAKLGAICNFASTSTVANAPAGSLPKIMALAPPYCGPTLEPRASIHIVPSGQPRVPMAFDFDWFGPNTSLAKLLATEGVPLPATTWSMGGDRNAVIWQPSTDTLWSFYLFQKRITHPKWWASSSNPNAALSGASGGSLPAGAIGYVATAIAGAGDSAGESSCTALATITSAGAGGTNTKVTLKGTTRWLSDGIRIYRLIGGSWHRLVTIHPPSNPALDQFSWTWTDDGTATPEKMPPDPLAVPATGDETHDEDGTRQNGNAYAAQWRAVVGSKVAGYSGLDGPVRPTDPGAASGSASRIPFPAGEITKADLQSGSIDHVLTCSFPVSLNYNPPSGAVHPEFVYPALSNDGTSSDPHDPTYGARYRLDPNLDIDALGFQYPLATMVAKAWQRYGLMTVETGGSMTVHSRSTTPDGFGWRPGDAITAQLRNWGNHEPELPSQPAPDPGNLFNPFEQNKQLMEVFGNPTIRANIQLVKMGWRP